MNRISRDKSTKTLAHPLSFMIVLALVLQGFALPALVAAQTKCREG